MEGGVLPGGFWFRVELLRYRRAVATRVALPLIPLHELCLYILTKLQAEGARYRAESYHNHKKRAVPAKC